MADSDEDRERGEQHEGSKEEDGKEKDGSNENDETEEPSGDDESGRYNLIAALNHKMRRQMLRRLDRSEEPLSPARLSEQLDVGVSNLSYHMDVLKKCDAVGIVDEQQVRGAVEHFYESKVTDHPGVQAMLEETEAGDEGQTKR